MLWRLWIGVILILKTGMTLQVDESSQYLVIPVNLLGLANRLRIIAGSYAIASAYKRKLIVAWQKNDDCLAEFVQLFDSGFDILSIDHQATLNFESSVRERMSAFASSSVIELYPQRFLVSSLEGQITTLWTRGTHAPSRTSCAEFLQLKNQFYQSLKPTNAVMHYVETVLKLFPSDRSSSPVIGVHIRAYDATHDWPVVTPLSVAQSALRFDEACSLDSFIVLMQHILKSSPSAKFFVASNSEEAKQLIVKMFGSDTVLALPSESNGDRSTTASIQLAAAELWLLGQSELILHSRGSSFGREAANINGIPVIDVSQSVDGGVLAFYSQDKSQPYCAMPEYVRVSEVSSVDAMVEVDGNSESSTSLEWNRVCYNEGPTEDPSSRVMCTVEYAVCLCSVLETDVQLLSDVAYCTITRIDYDSLAKDVQNSSCVLLIAESNGYSL